MTAAERRRVERARDLLTTAAVRFNGDQDVDNPASTDDWAGGMDALFLARAELAALLGDHTAANRYRAIAGRPPRKVAAIVDRPRSGRRRGPVSLESLLTLGGVDVEIARPAETGDVARGTQAQQSRGPIDPARLDVWLAEVHTSPEPCADRYTYEVVETRDTRAPGRTLRLVLERRATEAEVRELGARILSDPGDASRITPPVVESSIVADPVAPPWNPRP